MAFKKFKIIDDVLDLYQISAKKEEFLLNVPSLKMPELLRSDLEYVTKNFPYKVSEAAIRETILFPILKEVWKKHDDILMLWSNKSIVFDKTLAGMPDYIIAKQSHLGKIVFGKPLMAVVEAKKDDFEGGWAQCLLEMHTIRKINARPDLPVFGIVTNGDMWEFGQLLDNVFTDNAKTYTLFQFDELFSVIYTFFEFCKINALKV
jgi:hypothetical protein